MPLLLEYKEAESCVVISGHVGYWKGCSTSPGQDSTATATTL